MKKILRSHSLLLPALLFLASCSKGYEVRFINYSTEKMDSVIVGGNTLVFTNIERQTASGYEKIKSGSYAVQCVSASKKRYGSTLTVDKRGDGKISVQLDGTGAISILED